MSTPRWLPRLTPSSRSRRRRRKPAMWGTEQLESKALLSAFIVTTPVDAPDTNPGDGIAETATGETSLRAAVQEANASPGEDRIFLPPGIFLLTLEGEDDAALSGDLDVTESLTIYGFGRDETVIDAGLIDSAFHLHGETTLTIEHATVTSGTTGASISTEPDADFETWDAYVLEDEDTWDANILDDEDSLAALDDVSTSTLPAFNASPMASSMRQIDLLDSLFGRLPAGERPFELIPARRESVTSVRPDATIGIVNPPGENSLAENDSKTTDPKGRQTPREIAPRIAKGIADDATSDPTGRRRDVVNSLFRDDESSPKKNKVKPASGESEQAVPNDKAGPKLLDISPQLPQTLEGLPFLEPIQSPEPIEPGPAGDVPEATAPPGLPDDVIRDDEAARSSSPGAAVVLGLLMSIVRPGRLARTVKRFNRWSRLGA